MQCTNHDASHYEIFSSPTPQFLSTLSLGLSLHVKDQDLQSYRTANIIILSIFITFKANAVQGLLLPRSSATCLYVSGRKHIHNPSIIQNNDHNIQVVKDSICHRFMGMFCLISFIKKEGLWDQHTPFVSPVFNLWTSWQTLTKFEPTSLPLKANRELYFFLLSYN